MKSAALILAVMMLLVVTASCGSSTAAGGGQEEQPAVTQPSEQTPAEPATQTDPEVTTPNPEPESFSEEIFDGVEYETVEVAGLGTVRMPVMDPADVVPDDTEVPSITLSKITPGAVLHDSVLVSTVAIDNIGVNYMALYIDAEFRTANMAEFLEYAWETREMTDGMHVVQFLVRDAGHNVGVCKVYVRIDNTTDWGPPEILVDKVHCTFEGYEFNSADVGSPNMKAWNIAGRVELQIRGWDASGIKQLTAFAREPFGEGEYWWSDYQNLSKYHKIGHADGAELYLTFDASSMDEHQYIRAVAEDNAGEISEVYFELFPRNSTRVHALFLNRNGYGYPGVSMYLMPQDWEPSVSIDLSAAVKSVVSGQWGSCGFNDVPLGLNHFVIIHAGETQVVPYVALPVRDSNQLPDEGQPYVYEH